MDGYYILEGKVPVPCDLMTWAQWFGNINNRRVGHDKIGVARVSTVFLGFDHGLFEGEPELFETMVFLDDSFLEDHMTRCATWEQAERMHAEAVAMVRKAQAQIQAVLDD